MSTMTFPTCIHTFDIWECRTGVCGSPAPYNDGFCLKHISYGDTYPAGPILFHACRASNFELVKTYLEHLPYTQSTPVKMNHVMQLITTRKREMQ